MRQRHHISHAMRGNAARRRDRRSWLVGAGGGGGGVRRERSNSGRQRRFNMNAISIFKRGMMCGNGYLYMVYVSSCVCVCTVHAHTHIYVDGIGSIHLKSVQSTK